MASEIKTGDAVRLNVGVGRFKGVMKIVSDDVATVECEDGKTRIRKIGSLTKARGKT
jgi:hypothetical protein